MVIILAIGSLILTPMLLKTGLRWTQPASETDDESAITDDRKNLAGSHAIVLGAGPIGRQVSSRLEIAGKDVCLVDLSPINLHSFAQQGFRTIAGDATDPDVLRLAGVGQASTVVICIPDDDAAMSVIRNLRDINSSSLVLVRCRYQTNVDKLRKLGADHVVSEEALASKALLKLLEEFEQHQAASP